MLTKGQNLSEIKVNSFIFVKLICVFKIQKCVMAIVYIGLGTNLGNKQKNLKSAIDLISQHVGELLIKSSFFESNPWGFESEHIFLNAVIKMETILQPMELLAKTQEIEVKMGRTNKTQKVYSDRLIDIDILFYDNIVVDVPELKIPHTLLTQRDFVLTPLMEIAPHLVHPILMKTINDIYSTFILRR